MNSIDKTFPSSDAINEKLGHMTALVQKYIEQIGQVSTQNEAYTYVNNALRDHGIDIYVDYTQLSIGARAKMLRSYTQMFDQCNTMLAAYIDEVNLAIMEASNSLGSTPEVVSSTEVQTSDPSVADILDEDIDDFTPQPLVDTRRSRDEQIQELVDEISSLRKEKFDISKSLHETQKQLSSMKGQLTKAKRALELDSELRQLGKSVQAAIRSGEFTFDLNNRACVVLCRDMLTPNQNGQITKLVKASNVAASSLFK